MNKSTFFIGQPIFTQLLKLVSKEAVIRIAQEHKADRYSKRFSTYEHLVTILYSIFFAAAGVPSIIKKLQPPSGLLDQLG